MQHAIWVSITFCRNPFESIYNLTDNCHSFQQNLAIMASMEAAKPMLLATPCENSSSHHLEAPDCGKAGDFTSSDSESSYEPEESSIRCDSRASNLSLKPSDKFFHIFRFEYVQIKLFTLNFSDVLEYKSIYNWPGDARRGHFLPNEPLKALIVSVRKDTERAIHLMNPYLYNFFPRLFLV